MNILRVQRFILDTSALTHFKENICENINKLLDLIAIARIKLNISCHIPYPSVYDEIIQFLKNYNCSDDIYLKIDTWLVKKSPNRYEVRIPVEIFYEYIREMRERVNKGLKISENIIKEAFTLGRAGNETRLGDVIRTFRSKYRDALRYGTIDSVPDLDVLILAKELDAGVVACDEGIKRWSEKLGLRFIHGEKFPKLLEEYLKFSRTI